MTIRTTLRTVVTGLFLTFLCVATALAQEKDVSGTVIDGATGQPLPGANVSVKGTTTGTTTGMDGAYELTVPGPEAVLVYSFVGYQRQEVTVGDQEVIDVTLQEDVEQLDEVVVVGYGTQRRSDISGAVSSVDVADADVGQVTSTQDLIRGRIAGVELQENSGEPGAGVNIRVRGTSSISGGNDPLYVIDGIPVSTTSLTPGGVSGGGVTTSNTTNPLSLLNPQDVESIQILKDAASTAIYGSEGANGVVLIETKSGVSGSVQVDYSGRFTSSSVANEMNLLTGDEYRQAQREIFDDDVSSGPSVNTQDEVLQSALSQTHNLSFSGGNDQTTYRASLGYLDQEGILIENGIERATGRINAQHSSFNDALRFSLNLTGSYMERQHGFFNQGGGFEGGAIKSIIAWRPTLPLRTEDGELSFLSRDIRNPIGLQEQITDVTDQRRLLGNFTTRVAPIEGLVGKATIGTDIADAVRRSLIPNANTIGEEVGGIARQQRRELSSVVGQTTLEYARDLTDTQRLQLLGGFEYKRTTFQDFGIQTQDILDALGFNNLGAGRQPQTPSSEKQLVEQVSFFGRASYSLLDRYTLTASVRRDGSSVFGEDEKFAVFPSVSAGWNMHREAFLEDVDWIANLKLRASVGVSGNQAIPPLQTAATLSPDPLFVGIFGEDQTSIGVAPQRAPNPDLKWEQTTEYNAGVDFTLWRIDGALDVYRRETTDLLLDVNVPLPSVSTTVLQNIGEVLNQGVELQVNASVFDRNKWSLDVGGNINSNFNEVTDLGGREFIDHTGVNGAGQSGLTAQRLQEGRPIGSYYGPVFAGIDEDGQETYEAEGGGTTTDLSAARRDFIGNPVPDFSYGFNVNVRYSDFDLSAFFRGASGKKLFNNTALEFTTLSNFGRGINVDADALTDGTRAAFTEDGPGHTPVYSSRWIENASFLRLDNLTLGYTLPDASRFSLRRARVYVSAQNLFTITPYDGFDPEVNTNVNAEDTGFRALALPDRGIDYTSYPRARSFTFGVEVGL